MSKRKIRRKYRFHEELHHEVEGYTVLFDRGKRGFAAHSRGVFGRAFFVKRVDAVAFKRALEVDGMKSLKPYVVPAVAILFTPWAKQKAIEGT